MKVGLVVHDGREHSVEAAGRAAGHLHALDVDVVVANEHEGPERLDAPAAPLETFAEGLDLAISFGGDGTFLRAAHLCRDAGVPVLGVNLGRLGFLAEIESDHLPGALDAVAAGRYEVEERATLRAWVEDPDGRELGEGWALNELSIEKTARQRLLQMDVYLQDARVARVPADALIVATPTGSTAYALSAGGPILSPAVDATIVVPVAPHTLFDRTLVAAGHEHVRVQVLEDQASALVSCDGREPLTAPPGGAVHAVGGGRPVRLARVTRADFYGLVRRKFALR